MLWLIGLNFSFSRVSHAKFSPFSKDLKKFFPLFCFELLIQGSEVSLFDSLSFGIACKFIILGAN